MDEPEQSRPLSPLIRHRSSEEITGTSVDAPLCLTCGTKMRPSAAATSAKGADPPAAAAEPIRSHDGGPDRRVLRSSGRGLWEHFGAVRVTTTWLMIVTVRRWTPTPPR